MFGIAKRSGRRAGVRRRRSRAGMTVVTVVVVAVAGLAFSVAMMGGCGADNSEGRADFQEPISVGKALAAEDGLKLVVQGFLLCEGDEIRLCERVLESFPPQCGGDFLKIEGVEPIDFVGLVSPAASSVGREVSWSDQPRTVVGVKSGSTLAMQEVPTRVETTADQVRVRFSYAPQPLNQRGRVTWFFDVSNLGLEPLTLLFSTGQKGDVVLMRGADEVYRFGADKAFTEAMEEVTIEGGARWGFALEDELDVATGDVEVVARVTTRLPALPELALQSRVE
jgi:hypothetical protein